MGKKQKQQGKGGAQEVPPTSFDWDSKKSVGRKKRGSNLSRFLWLLGAVVAAGCAVAFQRSSNEMPSTATTVEAGGASDSVDEAKPAAQTSTSSSSIKKPMEPPPVDTWSKPEECLAWAGDGQCKANPEFMLQNCKFRSTAIPVVSTPPNVSHPALWMAGSPSPRGLSCAKLEFARQRYFKRCPKPENYKPALEPGMMASVFERIMTDFPELQPERISEDPPVILFHSFLSEEESAAFVTHGQGRYSKSLGVGMKEDGSLGDVQTEIRTSSHGWCQHPACLNDSHVQRVVARVANITQTPPVSPPPALPGCASLRLANHLCSTCDPLWSSQTNAEFAQLVYYHACNNETDGNCAFYKRHNDYIDGDEHKLQGVRVYTLFSYLNDVPAGGGTRFTDLPSGPVAFQPQKGKAILWPSVLSAQPHTKDDRTHHEALPVTAGEKYGANFWIHQYDFKGPYAVGCTA